MGGKREITARIDAYQVAAGQDQECYCDCAMGLKQVARVEQGRSCYVS